MRRAADRSAFPAGWVRVVHERPGESRYEVTGLARPVTVTARPKADGRHPAVALASLACKGLRELAMAEFNAFWAAHVLGLAPTAGYPADAGRFLAAIRPVLARLGIDEAAVWRCR